MITYFGDKNNTGSFDICKDIARSGAASLFVVDPSLKGFCGFFFSRTFEMVFPVPLFEVLISTKGTPSAIPAYSHRRLRFFHVRSDECKGAFHADEVHVAGVEKLTFTP